MHEDEQRGVRLGRGEVVEALLGQGAAGHVTVDGQLGAGPGAVCRVPLQLGVQVGHQGTRRVRPVEVRAKAKVKVRGRARVRDM
ncbi:hypothetical protein [Streptomyces sp. G45]|uniref:hypothetical protein n=1 Tax=Streptomyces sp. G45 TaxID=3406627 RepID=UPI003C20CBA0